MFVFESQIILQGKQTTAGLSEKEARVFCLRYFTFKTFYIILKVLYTSIFKLVSALTHSISRYIHIQTFYVHKRNVLRFLWHGTYHVVVRGGSYFCQSPKSGETRFFYLKRKGGPKLFFGKNTQIPQPCPPPPPPPPPRENVPSLT